MNMKICIYLILLLGPLAQVAPAQDLSEDDPKLRELHQLVFDLNHQEKAFRPTSIRRMLTEANQLAEELNLPAPRPIQFADLVKSYTSSPWNSVLPDNTPGLSAVDKVRRGQVAAMGRIETINYIFGFAEGRFSVVNQLQLEEVDHYQEWIHMPSLIDTNGAYQLATQWLAAVGVKMGTLKIKYAPQRSIEQSYVWNPVDTTNKSMLPIFTVSWGNDSNACLAQVRVLGITKEMLSLEVNEGSLSRRPPLILSSVANFEKYIRTQTNLPTMKLQHPSLPTNESEPLRISLPR